jgi:FkbM family methyltransferase
MMRHFPRANYLLVEAQKAAHGAALAEFKAAHRNVDYVLCAAGDRNGEIQFDASEPLGGAASSTPFAKNNIVVPMATVDTLVRQRNLRGAFCLKLDTHGFEVPILEGARETLSQASMLIIEAYNFTLRPGCLRFYELCPYLEAHGFRCVDVFDVSVRPLDSAFWQMDMVFLPSTHPVFRSNQYRSE